MKKRLDVILTEGGFAPSRERAKIMLMSGIVYVNGQKEDKPGTQFDPEKIQIEVRGETLRYVSRGGLKLEKALQVFPLDLSGKVCMDIGASTGGFTDCMLQNGAKLVYSIDVGYGQLDWKLRNDDRVICLEKTNFRYLTREELTQIKPGAEMVCLIKPQFEAGREKVGKKGVVRDPAVHQEVIRAALSYAAAQGFETLGLDYSPIRGPEGNIEYLMYIRKPGESGGEAASKTGLSVTAHDYTDQVITALVTASHAAFSSAGGNPDHE